MENQQWPFGVHHSSINRGRELSAKDLFQVKAYTLRGFYDCDAVTDKYYSTDYHHHLVNNLKIHDFVGRLQTINQTSLS